MRDVDPGEPEAPLPSGRDRRSVVAALLIHVALVGLVVCLAATDVLV